MEHLELELEAHIWWFCSTHEYCKTPKHELPTPSLSAPSRIFMFSQKDLKLKFRDPSSCQTVSCFCYHQSQKYITYFCLLKYNRDMLWASADVLLGKNSLEVSRERRQLWEYMWLIVFASSSSGEVWVWGRNAWSGTKGVINQQLSEFIWWVFSKKILNERNY